MTAVRLVLRKQMTIAPTELYSHALPLDEVFYGIEFIEKIIFQDG